jgi:hypothetical protein
MGLTQMMLVEFGPANTGQLGNVGYTIFNPDASVAAARSTSNVVDQGGGNYSALVTFPNGFAAGTITWDISGSKLTSEDVNITGGSGGTPTSTLVPYCEAAHFVERYDIRTVGDWLSDETPPRRLTPTEVLNSTVLATLLLEASGEIESACLMGERYTVDNLLSLTGGSAELLCGLVGGLTLGKLWGRRPRTDSQPFPTAARWAQDYLQRLATGERIFGLVEVTEAGRMDHDRETASVIRDRSLTVVEAARYFGRRADRSDPNRQ